MTLEHINELIERLWAVPSRERLLEACFALQEWMGLHRPPENPGRLLEPVTMMLQKQLVPAPITSQPQLYRISSKEDSITVRLAVLKKIKKDLLHLLVYKDPGFDSWQHTPDVLKATTKAPYFIHFVTTGAYDSLMIVLNRGDQKRIVVLRRRFTQTQNFKILSKWKDIANHPKAEIADLLWNSTDIKEVNKQFYSLIKQRFDDLIAILKKQAAKKLSDNLVKQFAVRLIGRYIFCWFLKEKEIIHEDILSSRTVEGTKDFYNRVLHRLFFDTLNSLAYPLRNLPADIPEELIKHFARIPYLNGGLFDLLEEDKLFPHPELNDWLVSFVKVLEQYGFTVDESSSTYQQVAIDPEMLGRIFENLLASINPETEKIANERKAFGAFYTPREIVDYMVNQSLKTYLETHLLEQEEVGEESEGMRINEPQPHLFSNIEPKQLQLTVAKTKHIRVERNKNIKEKIEKLFDTAYESNPFGDKETQQVRKLLDEIKVIDPACGSGAFPIGVLHRLEELHEKIGTVKTLYELRRDMLSQNIYGVDIMPMGVEISRLRAWLSLVLVCDYKPADAKHNFGIKPLPNLDFKFVAANSLIDSGYDEFVRNVNEWGSPTMMRLDGEIQKLERIRNNYFGSSASTDNKKSLVKEFNDTKNYIKTEFDSLKRKKGLNLGDFLSKIDDWDPFNDSKVSSFFSPAWMFGVNDGFDVVVGNPPYVPLENFDDETRELFRKNFKYVERKFETSVLFILRGFEIMKPQGVLSYISTITWQTGENYSKFREYVLYNKGISKIINLPFDIFQEGYVDTAIYFLKQQKGDEYEIYNFKKKDEIEDFAKLEFIKIKISSIKSPQFKLILDAHVDSLLRRFQGEKFETLGSLTISTQGLSGSNYSSIGKEGKNVYPFFSKGTVHNYMMKADEIYETDMSEKPSLRKFYEAQPKVLIRRIINRQDRLSVAFTDLKMVFKKDINPFIPTDKNFDAKYLQAILASKLTSHLYLKTSSIASKDDFRQTTLAELRSLPIPKISPKDQQPFIHLVNQILAAKKKNPPAATSELEKQIDVMVYYLYGLEYEEAKVIDGELKEEEFGKWKIEK